MSNRKRYFALKKKNVASKPKNTYVLQNKSNNHLLSNDSVVPLYELRNDNFCTSCVQADNCKSEPLLDLSFLRGEIVNVIKKTIQDTLSYEIDNRIQSELSNNKMNEVVTNPLLVRIGDLMDSKLNPIIDSNTRNMKDEVWLDLNEIGGSHDDAVIATGVIISCMIQILFSMFR